MKPATTVSFGFVELQAGGVRVRIVPELGGRIVSLEALGREWLSTSDGALDVDGARSPGYEDCFPTKASCRLPGDVPQFGGKDLAESGELRRERPSVAVEANSEGHQAVFTWLGAVLPYRFTRAVRVASSGTVTVSYAVTNIGFARLPFVWAARIALPLTAGTHLDLPNGARALIGASHGNALRGLPSEFRWPTVLAEKARFDFSNPEQVARRYACQLFVELPDGTKHVAVDEGDARLEIAFDSAMVRGLGLWLNKREWSPDRRAKPEQSLSLEPRIGSSDSLSEALGKSDGAQWLAPDEVREWTLTLRIARAESLAGARAARRGQ